jgi:pyruvate,water dikinase
MVTQNITPPIENLCKYAYSETLDTVCASAGVVTGIARLVFSKDDAYKVSPGDIMVAIGTDFDLMGAIQSSSGVITEEGGLLSHASVVCRELGIPCGIAVVDATKIIVDGSHIRLDATNGKVFLNINNSL